MNRETWLFAATGVFGAALLLSWFTQGTGVVRNDPARHIAIPRQLTAPLQVMAAYNGRDVFFRYRWPSPSPGIFHDVLKFEGGKWVVRGAAVPGSQPDGLHEDRVSMMVDDGSVPDFGRYGGYVTVGRRLAGFTDEVSGKDVAAHPYLGGKLKLDEPTKYLPATRRNLENWADVAPEDEQKALRAAGYFLDLWHWRANRSHPIGLADDQLVGEGRLSDAGKSPYATNWDSGKQQPRYMFDAARSGRAALRWEDIVAGKIGQDDSYFLREDQALAFDPGAGWKEGDTLPRRSLRPSDGSRGDIKVAGRSRWGDGFWDVTLQRRMDTGNRLDDKIFVDRGIYQAAFAIHRQATGGRWHMVSLPVSVGLGRQANIEAVRFEGDAPKWDQKWTEVTMFYPGQVNWALLNSSKHAGANQIRAGVPVRYRHSEAQLANYGIEVEFNDAIRRQWLLTMLAGVLLIAAFGVALNMLSSRKRSA